MRAIIEQGPMSPMRLLATLALMVCAGVAGSGGAHAEDMAAPVFDDAAFEDDLPEPVRDPLYAFNRGMYHVNDRLYFWVLKPVSNGYAAVLPEGLRRGVGNMFTNLGAPKRIVNCLFQGKFQGTAEECSRFMLNSTLGILGYRDVASDRFQIPAWREDLGQTLGAYGAGYGFYLTLPFLGPSNPRDTIGLIGDMFLDPVNYLVTDLPLRVGVRAGERINGTSLQRGVYEHNKELALDHYIWIRETYTQHRQKLVSQ